VLAVFNVNDQILDMFSLLPGALAALLLRLGGSTLLRLLAALLQPPVRRSAAPPALLWHPPFVLLHTCSTAAGVSLQLQ
jgi:hypothetical protein